MQSCFDESPFRNRCTPSQQPPVSYTPPEPEPMVTENMRLSFAERQRRISKGSCLYCGGHVMTTRPTRPPCLWVSAIRHPPQNMQPLTIVITLIVSNVSIPIHALIDSGSARNFISGNLCRQLKIHTTANSKVYQVQSITGRALSRHDVRLISEPITLRIGNLHEEDIKLLVLEEANTDIILGRPWFVLHEPQISWRTGDVLKWGDQCFLDCFPNLPRPSRPVSQTLSLNSTSIESPIEKQSVEIPECYAHFSDVFCPTKASQLPPHRPWDCAIDLLPVESVPKGKIYPLSVPEQKAMEEYIEEALQQGYIRPSTSPAASSFFFVTKKDGGLRPCIDYRALNNITVKFRYPLPLVPAALEHLRGATVFTMLDLRSAYNLPPDTWGGWMENSLRDPYRPLWISGHAIWPSQRPLRIPEFHAWGAPRVPPSLPFSLHRWHPDLLSELGRTSPPRCGGPSTSASISTLSQGREVFFPPILRTVPRLSYWQWWHPDGRVEGGSYQDLAQTFRHQGTPAILGIL